MRNTKKLVQGVAFVATIALLIGLSIAQYAGGVPVRCAGHAEGGARGQPAR